MTSSHFRVERLGDSHDRTFFRCGEEALDRYFQTQVTQDIRRNVANCFVAIEAATNRIAAYYTLSAASIPLTDLPVDLVKRLPRYPAIPAVRIGRLAVDQMFQRRGLGEAMLADAVARAVKADVAAYALVVEAKNDPVVTFYQRFGFRAVASQPRVLLLPIATARNAIRGR